jgi:hypothetical protein
MDLVNRFSLKMYTKVKIFMVVDTLKHHWTDVPQFYVIVNLRCAAELSSRIAPHRNCVARAAVCVCVVCLPPGFLSVLGTVLWP